MAEHVGAIEQLKKLPEGFHLFCPRQSDDRVDAAGQDDEAQRRQQGKERRELFFTALPLLAYDGAEVSVYHQWLYDTLDHQLGKCEACIRQYYLGKIDFKAKLLEDYDDDEVKQFLDIISRKDVTRIQAGLDEAAARLEPVAKDQRNPKLLGNKQLFALYETLHCDAFYTNDQLLRAHFDKPFQMVQTKKELKINEILPAIAKFLFSKDPFKMNWAVKTWQRLGRAPTDEEWDWAIKGNLKQELDHIVDDAGLIRFWGGLKIICDTMTSAQVQLKLFDLGFNFARLPLDHLAKKTMAVPHIAACLRIVWTKAPVAYWQALPAVSPATVAEQIFQSPLFDPCLLMAVKNQQGFTDVLTWTTAFLQGLQSAERPPAARTIVHQLFDRVDSDNTSDDVKLLCFEWAVKTLVATVLTFTADEKARNNAARPVLSDVLNLVSTHMSAALLFPVDASDQKREQRIREEVTSLVRNSLALECLILKSDYEALNQNKPKFQASFYTPDLWQTINRNLSAQRPDLSQEFLNGTMALAGLEKFPIVHTSKCIVEKESFNSTFTKVEDLLSQCVEHLAEFPAEHLDPLFTNQNANMALMALLFSGNEDVYQHTVELIKNIAQEPGRVEALSHVLQAFFGNTLYSICWVFRRTASMMPFSPIPRLLKTGKDIMDLLCDTTGMLRSRRVESRERDAVQAYWQYSWLILTTIFRTMEKWAGEVSDKPLMTEVCRNTMQYAQELFSHYYLFVKVLEQRKDSEKAIDVSKVLLNTDVSSSTGSPPKALDSMVKWLRLRDPYLAEALVNLIIELLQRLKEYGTTLPHDGYALKFIEEVATGSSASGRGTKTILNDNQKAALIRALEQFTGKQIARQAKATVKKQQRIDTWTDANNKSEPRVKHEVISIDDDNDDVEEAVLSDRKKDKLIQKQKATQIPPRPNLSLQEQLRQKHSASSRAFLEQRKKDQALAEAKRQELLARLKGQTGNENTANAGSGLSGLGVQGKDHSTPKSELMVSSDSDSQSSGDEELWGDTKPTSTAVGRRTDMPNVPKPLKKIKQVRTAKDMRARLSPDLAGLHKTILSWDFFAETETPPSSNKQDYTLVTNTFKTVEEYQRTFEPLLILEGWQSFRTAREDGNFKPFEIKVANSMVVDNFFEVNSTVPMMEGRELGLATSDVVLLSKGSRPHVEPNEPHCLARVKEITRKRGEMQIVYRINSANNPLRNHLHDKSTIYAVSILSLTPLEREYGALMALPYYDLCEEIIRAKPSPLLEYSDNEVREIQDLHNLNTAQAKAVKSAIDNDAFTLIQGPPGSGKTKTITAILGTVMNGLPTKSGVALPRAVKKILVAAPSNAAVDELVMRFKDGIKVSGGETRKVNVVRLGRSEAINTAVKDVTLEELVNARLNQNLAANGNGAKEDIHTVMMDHKKASEEMLELKRTMEATRQKGQQVSSADDQLHELLRKKKTSLSAQIDRLREQQNSASRDADINRRRVQQEILDSADVLCATLSGSGHEVFQGLNVEFETVIIDEAAQSIELSALIPLKYGCSKCILVGDPKQLPPTVLSRQAAKYQYEQSLFARMEKNHSNDVHLLDVQYRMHPEISAFPSKTFYDSKLRDGNDMARLRARPWHRSQIFAPYRFFDVQGMSHAAPKGRSLVNEAEIEAALAMYDRLVTDLPRYDLKNKIGIITPYKGQLKLLRQKFSMRYGESILNAIDFNTTDAFQGRESEIIIFSCVRANTQGIGFLNDVRRMNVGLTRAKCSLWVLGNSQSLIQGQFWRALVEDAKSRALYTNDNIVKLMGRTTLTEEMMRDDVDMGGMDEPSNVTESSLSRATADMSEARGSRQSSTTPSVISRGSVQRGNMHTVEYEASDAEQKPVTTASSARSTPPMHRPDPPSRQTSATWTSRSSDDRPLAGPEATKSMIRENVSKADNVSQGKGTYGPSGGRSGLNPRANCTYCGSDQHFSHNCPNDKAREASLGLCGRCNEAGHMKNSCMASRCTGCGEIGHLESACKAVTNKKLSAQEKRVVVEEEIRHSKNLQRQKEKLAKRQLGEHGASIPEVKTSSDSADKRKRESLYDTSGPTKLPRYTVDERSTLGNVTAAPQIRGHSAMGSRGPGNGTPGPPVIRKKTKDENSIFAKKR